jgi:PilZ domain
MQVSQLSSMKKTIIDRRVGLRHSLRIPLRVRVCESTGSGMSATSINISPSGTLVESELPLQLGSAVEVHLELPAVIAGEEPAKWHCHGRVVRILGSTGVGPPYQTGICFEWVDARPKQGFEPAPRG